MLVKVALSGLFLLVGYPLVNCVQNSKVINGSLAVEPTELSHDVIRSSEPGFVAHRSKVLNIVNPRPGLVGGGGTFGSQSDSDNIVIEQSTTTNQTGGPEHQMYFIVKNTGSEDEYVRIKIHDELGYAEGVPPTEFYLAKGASKEISVKISYPVDGANETSPDKITINAEGRRNTVKRNAYYYPGDLHDAGFGYQPFCFDRYVSGNCRYRTEPYTCDQYKWTAFATVQSQSGIQQLRSTPDGLILPPEFFPGTRDRIRVSTTTSCCFPSVQFLSVHPFYPNVGIACVVDIRELQGLNPLETAAVVVGVALILVIIVVIAATAIKNRKRRALIAEQKVMHSATRTAETGLPYRNTPL